VSISIIPINESTLDAAAEVHGVSWRASHAHICSPATIEAHTTARQRDYLGKKLQNGARAFLLTDGAPAGVVVVNGNLIEDLYVLPEQQGRGYGTALLLHAIRKCVGTPTLWVLESNRRAAQLYKRLGFRPTGQLNRDNGPLAEIEYAYPGAGTHAAWMETARLLIRRFTLSDAEALFSVLSDPEVMRYIEPPFSIEQTKAFIQEAGLRESPLVYAVLWKGSGSPLLIGHLIWHPWDAETMELGWILRRDFWGRGIATELTEHMLAQTNQAVLLECSPEQAATQRIAQRFGFQRIAQDSGLLQFIKREKNTMNPTEFNPTEHSSATNVGMRPVSD